MTRSVVFRRIAKLDLEDAAAWYEEREEGLGTRFDLRLNNNSRELLPRPISSVLSVVPFVELCFGAFHIPSTS